MTEKNQTGYYEDDGEEIRFAYHKGNKHKWQIPLKTRGLDFDLSGEVSFRHGFYPMYVMNIRQLKKLKRLPFHEEALKAGLLQMVTENSVERTSCIFVSHNWEDPDYMYPADKNMEGAKGFPDDGANSKLKWLQNAARNIDFADKDFYIWIDYFSIPQHPKNMFMKMLAMRSLPFYMSVCAECVALVRDMREAIRGIAGGRMEDRDRDRGLVKYQSRGWCRLELLLILCPKQFPQGGWAVGGPVYYWFYKTNLGGANERGPRIGLGDMMEPDSGEFSTEADADIVDSILGEAANQYERYIQEQGLTSLWDHCVRAHDRPAWLKDEADEELLARKPKRVAKQMLLPGASEAAAMVARWGERQLAVGDFQAGTMACTIAVMLAPNRPEPHLWLGMLFVARSNQERQAQLLEKYPLPKHRAGTYANFYMDQALECFQSALKFDPNNALACYGLGDALMRKQMKAEATKQYQVAVVADGQVAQKYEKMMKFFAGGGTAADVDLQARDRERDKEARRMRYELSQGWKIKRVV